MDKSLMVVMRDINANGFREFAYGLSGVAITMVAHCENRARLKGWKIFLIKICLVATADAPNAFAVVSSTGVIWAANIPVFTWNPLLYDLIWWFPTTRALYTAAQPVTVLQGVNQVGTTSITSAINSNLHLNGVNESRLAINASTFIINETVYVALVAK